MQVGPIVPQSGPFAQRDLILRHAQTAEAAGYDALWVNDHVVYPRDYTSKYPYSPTGRLPARVTVEGSIIEPLTLLTFVAAVTTRVQLGTAVLVTPMRAPVLLAKIIASLDHLAGGRYILGAGMGWAKEEFEVLSMPFDRRGKRFEEGMELMQRLWTEDWVDGFDGEFYEVDGWTSKPQPPRRVPVWLGGESDRQFRRVGQWADGWLTHSDRIPRLGEDIDHIRREAEKASRGISDITIAMTGIAMLRREGLEDAAERLQRAKEAGVQHATLATHPRDLEAAPELLEEFAQKYLPELQKD